MCCLNRQPDNASLGFPGAQTVMNLLQYRSQSVQFSRSVVSLCNPVDCSTPGLPVHHQLLELAQTYVHLVSDAIQPSHPLSSPPSPAFNLSQHQVFSSESVLCIRWQCRRPGFNPPVRKIPCRREQQTTPVFLPGEFHGQRSPVGYSPRDYKELGMTE